MIYADYNGSAPLHEDVRKYLIERLESGPYANPNAIHSEGAKVFKGMEKCRRICAQILGARPDHLIFNSGASEGISTVFHSLLYQGPQKTGKDTIIISGIEHSAVLNSAKFFEKQGYRLLTLPVNEDGVVELAQLARWLEEYEGKVALVAVMAANNETGVIQPFQEMARLCQKHQTKYLCDTTQIIGKAPFHFLDSGVDFAVLSGHKIGALTGSGALLAKNPADLVPLIHGGGQEHGLRNGTQNYIGNETLAVALTAFSEGLDQLTKAHEARLEFEKNIKSRFPQVVIVGENVPRVATTTLISFPGLHGQAVQIELESNDIFVTTSSACSDNDPNTSKVLKAMKVEDAVGRGVVRISVGPKRAQEIYPEICRVLSASYEKLSKIKNF